MKKLFMQPEGMQGKLLAVIYLVLGILLLISGGGIVRGFARILGLVFLIYGIVELYIYFIAHKQQDPQALTAGVPCFVFGLIITLWPHFLINFFPIIFGLLLLYFGVTQLQSAFMLKSVRNGQWSMVLIMAIIMLIVGLFICTRPTSAINLVCRIMGCFLLSEGAMMLAGPRA